MNSTTMTITTERAEELAVQREHQEDYRCAEAIRALVNDRDSKAEEIARLQKTISNLEARDIHSCGPDCTRSGCVNRRLANERDELKRFHELDTLQIAYLFDERKELAAAQAVIADLKSEISLIAKTADSKPIRDMAKEVLERRHDDTALRELLADQWEKAANVCDYLAGCVLNGNTEAIAQRKYCAKELRSEAEKLSMPDAQSEAA